MKHERPLRLGANQHRVALSKLPAGSFREWTPCHRAGPGTTKQAPGPTSGGDRIGANRRGGPMNPRSDFLSKKGGHNKINKPLPRGGPSSGKQPCLATSEGGQRSGKGQGRRINRGVNLAPRKSHSPNFEGKWDFCNSFSRFGWIFVRLDVKL